jgi:putative hydrolase of the HAD superfamily
LAIHRIRKFHLADFMDYFIISSFVRFRKPDEDIFRLALDLAQVRPEQALFIDDRLLFVEVAQGMGIHSIYHENLDKTCKAIEELGVSLPEACILR